MGNSLGLVKANCKLEGGYATVTEKNIIEICLKNSSVLVVLLYVSEFIFKPMT